MISFIKKDLLLNNKVEEKKIIFGRNRKKQLRKRRQERIENRKEHKEERQEKRKNP
jgi:hypothetical protein